MPEARKARAVGFNHVALEVGDIEEALAFYGRLFDFKLRGKSKTSAFIDLGDQFLALQKGRRQPPDDGRQARPADLLDGGPAALAIAPANYRSEHARTFGRLGLLASLDDDAALETAHDLAESLGARVTRDEPHVDLLVIGSRPEASQRRVLISGSAQNAIDNATSPVLVLPRGVSVRFPLIVGA